jgi:biotin carboxylase
MGKVNGLGLMNNEVLVQEYLDGQEYVVDMVSRDGVHKVVALWECDKRAVNGAHFVLHGYIPTVISSEHHDQLVAYQKKVLTALGILNGPSHGELKWCHGEPVLVEVGARCHGGEGTWVDVANNVYGYNQVSAAATVYLDCQEFDQLPPQVSSSSPPLSSHFLLGVCL